MFQIPNIKKCRNRDQVDQEVVDVNVQGIQETDILQKGIGLMMKCIASHHGITNTIGMASM